MKKDGNNDPRKILIKMKNACKFLARNNWIFTVAFFLGVFATSVLVWYQIVLYPKPSVKTKNEIEASRKDYSLMMQEIEKTAQMLGEKKKNFNSQPPVSLDRELFYRKEDVPQEVPADQEDVIAEPVP